jgi:hypothetical protein
MSFQDIYLILVVAAFSSFAIALAGASIWSKSAAPRA